MSIFPELARLESDISVAETVSRLRRPAKRYARQILTTDCPSCGQSAWILPTGLFCNAFSCKFTAGGPLEYVAITEKIKISESYDRLRQLFPDRRHFWESTDAAILKQLVVQQTTDRRRLFEFFSRLADRPSVRGDTALAAEFTHEWRIHLNARQMTLFHAAPDDLQSLAKLLPVDIPTHETLVLFPYYCRHHHVAAVMLFNPESLQTSVIEVDPARCMFSGLLDSSPSAALTYLLDDPVSALRGGAALNLRGDGEGMLGLLVNYEENAADYLPERAVFCLLDDTYPGLAATYRQIDPTVRFVRGLPPGTSEHRSWEAFVTTTVLDDLVDSNGRLEHATATFAQAAELTPSERKALVHTLYCRGYTTAAERLTTHFSSRTIFRQKNLTIKETPVGYQAYHGAFQEAITNFTYELDYNLVFEDGAALYHSGLLTLRDKSYRAIISSDDLAAINHLQSRLQQTVLRAEETPGQLPIIRSRNLWKNVVLALRENIGSLETRRGVSSLGWHHSRKKYTMPGCVIDLDGAKPGPHELHPDVPILSYFQSFAWDGKRRAAPALRTEGGYVTAGMADLARIILGGVFRDYFNLDMAGVALQHHRSHQHVLERVFMQLGQSRPFLVNGPSPEGIGRFPIYGYEHDVFQLNTARSYLISAGKSGMPLADINDIADEEADDFGQWLMSAIVILVEHLLARGDLSFPDERHVVFVNTVISDGENLLKHVFGLNWPSRPLSFAALENLLEHCGSPEVLAGICEYEYQSQCIWLDYSTYRDDAEYVQDLELEFRSQSTHILREPGKLAIPSPIFCELAQGYYRRPLHVAKNRVTPAS